MCIWRKACSNRPQKSACFANRRGRDLDENLLNHKIFVHQSAHPRGQRGSPVMAGGNSLFFLGLAKTLSEHQRRMLVRIAAKIDLQGVCDLCATVEFPSHRCRTMAFQNFLDLADIDAHVSSDLI